MEKQTKCHNFSQQFFIAAKKYEILIMIIELTYGMSKGLFHRNNVCKSAEIYNDIKNEI